MIQKRDQRGALIDDTGQSLSGPGLQKNRAMHIQWQQQSPDDPHEHQRPSSPHLAPQLIKGLIGQTQTISPLLQNGRYTDKPLDGTQEWNNMLPIPARCSHKTSAA